MTKVMASIVALALVIVVTGCATLPMESRLDKPVSMTKMTTARTNGFFAEKRAFWVVGGLAPLSIPEVDEVIGHEVSGHVGVQNLKITTEFTAVDILINVLTGGIIYSRTINIEGEVYD